MLQGVLHAVEDVTDDLAGQEDRPRLVTVQTLRCRFDSVHSVRLVAVGADSHNCTRTHERLNRTNLTHSTPDFGPNHRVCITEPGSPPRREHGRPRICTRPGARSCAYPDERTSPRVNPWDCTLKILKC